MKIKKLYTLSQFVDSQRAFVLNKTKVHSPKDVKSNNVDKFNDENLFAYGRIIKYNEFLKQPITKEMFVNEYKCVIPFETSTDKDLWCASEKKVIFKNVKYINLQPSTTFNYYSVNKVKVIHDSNTGSFAMNMTLHYLAEATNGELELKNMEI